MREGPNREPSLGRDTPDLLYGSALIDSLEWKAGTGLAWRDDVTGTVHARRDGWLFCVASLERPQQPEGRSIKTVFGAGRDLDLDELGAAPFGEPQEFFCRNAEELVAIAMQYAEAKFWDFPEE